MSGGNFEGKDADPTGFPHNSLEQGQSNSAGLQERSNNVLMDTAESSVYSDVFSPGGEGPASVESLNAVEKDMIDGLSLVGGEEIITCYCPFEIAAEIAEPTESDTPSIFMEDFARLITDLGECNSSMLKEAMRRITYDRKISASLYAMNGISEYFRYTSEPALDLSKDYKACNGDRIYQISEQSKTCSWSHSSDSADGVEMMWNSWNLNFP